MGNLSYVRMRNTVRDLRDCYENINEPCSAEEGAARAQLIALCSRIVYEADPEFTPEQQD